MPIDRPNVFGQGAATNTDLYIDASTKRLGEATRVISFYGHNPDADAIPEYVTFNGGSRSPTSSGYYDGISSSSASDSSSGTGAQTMLIEGIDDDGDFATEVVTMNGTNRVSLANNYYVVNTCAVLTAGLTGGNLGTISLRVGLSTTVSGSGSRGALHNLGAAGYPRGFTPMLQNIQVNASRDSASTVAGDIRVQLFHVQNMEDDVVVQLIREYKFPFSTGSTGTQTQEEKTLVPPHIITSSIQGTDFTNVPTSGYFYFYAIGDAALNAVISCRADLLYRDVRG